MNFNEIVVKESPGLCRCCLSEGCYKDLSSEYTWMNESEVYADMLLECFDISISQQNEGPDGSQRLVCEVCITRLRDACNFKKQVMDSEKKFVDMLGRGEFRPKVVVYQSDMKVEENAEVMASDNEAEVEYLEDDADYVTELLKTENSMFEEATRQEMPAKAKRGRPRKNPSSKPEKKTKVVKASKSDVRIKKAIKELKPTKVPSRCITKRRRQNLVIIFANTTIIPFKWCRRYACFYCSKRYDKHDDLVKHTKYHGSVSQPLALSRRRDQQDIKLDVSDITCEICNEIFTEYDSIVDHLIDAHELNYDKKIDMSLDRYRLVDLKCLMCEKYFEKFNDLSKHTKHHYKASYVCNECGKSFAVKKSLSSHINGYHRTGNYSCKLCPSTFDRKNLLNAHKGEHMAPCSVCRKRYTSISGLKNHMKIYHDIDFVSKIDARYNDNTHDTNVEATSKVQAKIIKHNLVSVLNMTTALPFKFYGNKLCCLVCVAHYEDHEDLREHTQNSHPNFDSMKKRRLKELTGVSGVFKVDISQLSCKICHLKFDNLENIIDHLIDSHKVKYDKSVRCVIQPFTLKRYDMRCPKCDERFVYFRSMYLHWSNLHSSSEYLCSCCGKGFSNSFTLKVHLSKSHADPGVFKCDVCGLDLKSDSVLLSHKAKVHGISKVNCSKCQQKFPSHYDMKKHLIEVHDIGHKCNYCGRMFVKDSFMRQHIRRTHLKEKNVECSVCNMKFFNGVMLQSHMVKHIGVKNFHCDVCGKCFYWKKNLVSHVARHNINRDLKTRKQVTDL